MLLPQEINSCNSRGRSSYRLPSSQAQLKHTVWKLFCIKIFWRAVLQLLITKCKMNTTKNARPGLISGKNTSVWQRKFHNTLPSVLVGYWVPCTYYLDFLEFASPSFPETHKKIKLRKIHFFLQFRLAWE